MNFVRANDMAYFCLGGFCKEFYHRFLLVYLKRIPRKYKVQHSAQLHTGSGSLLLLEVREFLQLMYVCVYR